MNNGLQNGYTCRCEMYHKFPLYVYAHMDYELVHICLCGRRNFILGAAIIKTEYDVTRPYGM